MIKKIFSEILQFFLACIAISIAGNLTKAILRNSEFDTPTLKYFIVGNLIVPMAAIGVSKLFPKSSFIGISVSIILYWSFQIYIYLFVAPEYWMYGAVLIALLLYGFYDAYKNYRTDKGGKVLEGDELDAM